MLTRVSVSSTSSATAPHASRPYLHQAELIRDRLHAIRLRVRAVLQHLESPSFDASGEPADQSRPLAILADAEIDRRIASSTDRSQLPILRLRAQFGLSSSEECVLWVLLGQELCPLIRQLLRAIATEAASDPTTDTIRRVVYGETIDQTSWHELGVSGVLRRSGFIERSDDDREAPEHRQTWKVTRRVLALAHGELALDPSLADFARLAATPPAPASALEVADGLLARLDEAVARDALVVVHGPVGHGRRSVLTAAATAHARTVLLVEGRGLAKERDVLQRQLRAVARECRLLELTPLIRDLDAIAGSGDAPDRIDLVEQELPGLVLATALRPVARRWSRVPVMLELAAMNGAQRARLWARALPMAGAGDAEVLATMYPLAPSLIEAAGRFAIDNAGPAPMQPHHIQAGLRSVLDDRLVGLATRVTVTQTWNDLVLPEDQTIAIVELLARIRERRRVYEEWGFAEKLGKGLGVSALLSGPPGTGKTMTAGLIARALHTELYQVDLSKIVSKWIGETEKNLAALFDAAEAGHAVLLFDEADSLFGKRTDVKSSNDRHANQQVNFLLQRLETYAGICLLTTNHETAVDEAFRRRLSVHVRFPMPEVEERRRLWQALIPAAAPTTGDLDLQALADTYVMSGGYIKNAVLRAAFLAADEQQSIAAAHLNRAAQLEYESLGKIVATKQA